MQVRRWLAGGALTAALMSFFALTPTVNAGDGVAAAPAESQVPQRRISSRLAARLAVNKLRSMPGGLALKHPRHLATFTRQGVAVAPRNAGPVWRWQLTHLGAAGNDLAGETPTPVARWPRLVHYERGTVIEEYRPKIDTLEQRFILRERLPLRGQDLVIAGQITCPGQFRETQWGWSWSDDQAALNLGRVRVYDATGRDLPARMQATASSTRIVVDGEALEQAVYPVVVDPEIGTDDFRISNRVAASATFDSVRADVVYNSTNNIYLVVFQGDAGAAGEEEIYGQLIDASNGMETGVDDFRISDMGNTGGDTNFDAFFPAVAWNKTDNEYLVVWEGDDDNAPLIDDEYEIFGQRLLGATGAEVGTNDFRISDMGTNGDNLIAALAPDVAWNSTDNEYLVVWRGDDDTGALVDNEMETYGQRLSNTGAEIGANDIRLSDMGSDGDVNFQTFEPAVAYNATDNEYLVVWHGDDDTGALVNGENEVYAQRVSNTGAEVGTNDIRVSDSGNDGSAAFDAEDPAVAWNSVTNEYLVVWAGDDNIAPLINLEDEIFGQRLSNTGAEVGTNDFRISDMGPNGNNAFDASVPAVTFDANSGSYFVVWRGDDDTAPQIDNEFEIFGQRLDGTGNAVSTNDVKLSGMGTDGSVAFTANLPAVAAGPSEQLLIVWDGDTNVAPLNDNETEVFGQRFQLQGSVKFSATNYAVAEDDNSVTITVTRTGTGVASIQFTTADNTATAPDDYTTATGTLNFGAAETQKTFTVNIQRDTLTEGNELVNLTLFTPVGVLLGAPNAATITISDPTSNPTSGSNKPINSPGSGQTVVIKGDSACSLMSVQEDPVSSPLWLALILVVLAAFRRRLT